MSNYSTETLTVLIESLKEEIEDGFKGVHDRQDTTNGKVIKHEKWINENSEMMKNLILDRERKFLKLSDLLWKIVQTVVFIVLGVKVLL